MGGRRRSRLCRAAAAWVGYRSAGAGRVRVVTTPGSFLNRILTLMRYAGFWERHHGAELDPRQHQRTGAANGAW
jgi:hypothetical protein